MWQKASVYLTSYTKMVLYYLFHELECSVYTKPMLELILRISGKHPTQSRFAEQASNFVAFVDSGGP